MFNGRGAGESACDCKCDCPYLSDQSSSQNFSGAKKYPSAILVVTEGISLSANGLPPTESAIASNLALVDEKSWSSFPYDGFSRERNNLEFLVARTSLNQSDSSNHRGSKEKAHVFSAIQQSTWVLQNFTHVQDVNESRKTSSHNNDVMSNTRRVANDPITSQPSVTEKGHDPSVLMKVILAIIIAAVTICAITKCAYHRTQAVAQDDRNEHKTPTVLHMQDGPAEVHYLSISLDLFHTL